MTRPPELSRVAAARVAAARVARLATLTPAGAPHLVPVVFVLLRDAEGHDVLWTAVDSKPKSSTRLQRLANIAADPAVSLIVDHYAEEWDDLWWARADGRAEVVAVDAPQAAGVVAALCAKYVQYQDHPPTGPLIRIRVEQWRTWSARPFQV